MSDPESPLLPHGGYRHLRSYKVAAAVYDATVVFCDRFVDKRSRRGASAIWRNQSSCPVSCRLSVGGPGAPYHGLLLQDPAVRSPRATPELAPDYESFLIQRGLRVWHKDSPEGKAMRERLTHDVVPELPPAPEGKVRLSGLAGLSAFVAKAEPELAANAMLCATNQAAYLLKCQIESQGRDFTEKGGFTERLYATRMKAREAGKPEEPAPPVCPQCGKPMRRRTAKKGPQEGQPFWGCSGYPDCKGTRAMSDKSDESDKGVNP